MRQIRLFYENALGHFNSDFPIMGVGLYLLIGLNGGTHKMRERYAEIDSKLLPMLPDNQECLSRIKEKIPKAGNIQVTYKEIRGIQSIRIRISSILMKQ